MLPTIGQSLNFVAWTTYALQKGDAAVLRVNAIGCGFALLYIGVFGAFSRGAAAVRLWAMLAAAAAFAGGSLAGIAFGVADADARVTALGAVAVACACTSRARMMSSWAASTPPVTAAVQ